MMNGIKLFSLNNRGLNNKVNLKQMTFNLLKLKPEIGFLQEMQIKQTFQQILKF